MRAPLTISCFAACLLATTAAPAQEVPASAAPPPSVQLPFANCHPSSFGKLVDVTMTDGRTLRASIRCLDLQQIEMMRDGVVTRAVLTDVRRIKTPADPVWDGALKGAAVPLILSAIVCGMDCLSSKYTARAALGYGLLGLTWDALDPNRKTIYDSGGRRSPSLTTSVSIPLLRW